MAITHSYITKNYFLEELSTKGQDSDPKDPLPPGKKQKLEFYTTRNYIKNCN